MKHTKRILLLMAILLQSNIAISQRILIKETFLNRNTELLTEIESMTRVVSACQIDVNKDVLFTEDTSFQVMAFNRKDPYDYMMNRMNDYFRKLTGEDTVGISLSDRPMLYFNPRAKTHINYYYALW